MPMPPPVLYKYYTPQRVDFFDNWTVRFSNPASFNDAFDSNWSAPTYAEKRERAKFRASLGIFCTTEDPDNHLMWVHYAAQHTGFVIGFKSSGRLFLDGGELRDVKYARRPPSTGHASLDLCWYKDRHWSYEREWRCIREICPGKARDVSLDPEEVSEVILGSAMTSSNVTAILESVDPLRPEINIPINRSVVDVASRRIWHEPAKLSLCSTCSGKGHVRF
jgi:Protein of unknown function (DUF2971)